MVDESKVRYMGAVNRLRGVLGVASVWTTNPTFLARCTDGDQGNMTGEGSKAVAAWTQVGQLDFDMGTIYNVHFRMKHRVRSAFVGNNTIEVWAFVSEDNATWFTIFREPNHFLAWILNNTYVDGFSDFFGRCRYLRLQWYNGANATTISAAIYEIQALDYGV